MDQGYPPQRRRLFAALAGTQRHRDHAGDHCETGHQNRPQSPRRAFHTPELEKGQDYYYVLRAEVVRDGKPVSETRRVIVRAGETVQETFREPAVTTTTAALTMPPAQ